MTPQQIEAMKRALEALKWCHGGEPCGTSEAITAIEEALAEHAMREVQRLGQEIEQEPVRLQCVTCGTVYADGVPPQVTQPEQEPVAVKRMKEWIEYLKRKSDFGQHMKIPSEMSAGACWELAIELEQFINTTPPQRKPLTDEEMKKIWYAMQNIMGWYSFQEIARSIEAAHDIKENQ